jgi:hypothetical protein
VYASRASNSVGLIPMQAPRQAGNDEMKFEYKRVATGGPTWEAGTGRRATRPEYLPLLGSLNLPISNARAIFPSTNTIQAFCLKMPFSAAFSRFKSCALQPIIDHSEGTCSTYTSLASPVPLGTPKYRRKVLCTSRGGECRGSQRDNGSGCNGEQGRICLASVVATKERDRSPQRAEET